MSLRSARTDGGANDVLWVNPRTGRISTFFVPPTAKTPECRQPGAQANPGRITHAQVTMPTGLEYFGGRLYASSWSMASFLGIQHAGRLVQVSDRAFH
jgi:hypothetical protein